LKQIGGGGGGSARLLPAAAAARSVPARLRVAELAYLLAVAHLCAQRHRGPCAARCAAW
jgi:hypothetical protein